MTSLFDQGGRQPGPPEGKVSPVATVLDTVTEEVPQKQERSRVGMAQES